MRAALRRSRYGLGSWLMQSALCRGLHCSVSLSEFSGPSGEREIASDLLILATGCLVALRDASNGMKMTRNALHRPSTNSARGGVSPVRQVALMA